MKTIIGILIGAVLTMLILALAGSRTEKTDNINQALVDTAINALVEAIPTQFEDLEGEYFYQVVRKANNVFSYDYNENGAFEFVGKNVIEHKPIYDNTMTYHYTSFISNSFLYLKNDSGEIVYKLKLINRARNDVWDALEVIPSNDSLHSDTLTFLLMKREEPFLSPL